MPMSLSAVHLLFSATHFLGHGFGLIPAPGSFAASAFTVPPEMMRWVPPIKQPLALGAEATRFCVPQENGAEKGEVSMSYLYVKWNSFSVRFTRRRLSH